MITWPHRHPLLPQPSKIVVALLLVWLCKSFSPTSLFSQDIHYSLVDVDPLLFNPAYTGFFDGQGRFGIAYRNQWASVSTPFQTISATAEWTIKRNNSNISNLSMGLCLSNDRAGTLNYGSTSAALSLAYFFSPIASDDNLISLAAELGVGQSGFSTSNIILSGNDESFSRMQALYPMLGAGIAWFRQYNDQWYSKLGFSVRNLTQPNISYLDMADTRLSRKYNLYARAEYRFLSNWGLLPLVGYQRQRQYSEILYGADVKWYVRERRKDYLAFSGGVILRHGDAASVCLGMDWRSWVFAFSYDANISSLAAASHTIGAFEIGIVYLLRKEDKKHRAIPCPII